MNKKFQNSSSTDVVIIGAGPTGLMAAGLLQRAGVRVRLVDKNPQAAHETRAFGIQAKSMELFQFMGIVPEFLKRGVVGVGVEAIINGRRIGGFNLNDLGRDDSPYNFLFFLPQSEIEKILGDDLRARGVSVEHGTAVTGFTQDRDGVHVETVDENGVVENIEARFLIGADGAHSLTRKTLGLSFEGSAYPQDFLIADCKIEWPWDYEHIKIFMRKRSIGLYFPLRGKELGRLIVITPSQDSSRDNSAQREATSGGKVALADVQVAISAAAGREVQLSNPTWTTRYRVHHRGANHYGVGRAFIAGDAAHIHSPIGAQGMNTGLQDVANLCWKLALAVHNDLPPSSPLLATYEKERLPVGRKLLNFTDRIFAFVSSPLRAALALRNAVIPFVVRLLTPQPAFRRFAFNFISQLGIRYHGHEFLVDDLKQGSWREDLAPGRRAPNADITRTQDVFQLLEGYHFNVLALSQRGLGAEDITRLHGELEQIPRGVGLAVRTHLIAYSLVGYDERLIAAESNRVFEAYGLDVKHPAGLFLVRPDGFIAYRSDKLETAGLIRFLEQFGNGESAGSVARSRAKTSLKVQNHSELRH